MLKQLELPIGRETLEEELRRRLTAIVDSMTPAERRHLRRLLDAGQVRSLLRFPLLRRDAGGGTIVPAP